MSLKRGEIRMPKEEGREKEKGTWFYSNVTDATTREAMTRYPVRLPNLMVAAAERLGSGAVVPLGRLPSM